MKPMIFCQLILFLAVNSAHARTRDEVLVDAAVYKNHPWTPSANNILDIEKYVLGSTTPVLGEGGDGIDDRMGLIIDRNGDGLIDIEDINDDNRRNWPFVVGSSVDGEAYAYGSDHSTATFVSYLATRIAGSRQIDVDLNMDKIVDSPLFYRITGIDCSGFVQQAYGLPRRPVSDPPGTEKYNVTALKGISRPVSLGDLKPGDILASGGHVLIFERWEEKHQTAHVRHAVPYTYSGNVHKRRVIDEIVAVSSDPTGGIMIFNANRRKPIPHSARSAFPQFAWTSPAYVHPHPLMAPLNQIIELEVVSRSSVMPSSVMLVFDDHLPDATTVYAGMEGFSVTPSSPVGRVTVRYAVPSNRLLSIGVQA